MSPIIWTFKKGGKPVLVYHSNSPEALLSFEQFRVGSFSLSLEKINNSSQNLTNPSEAAKLNKKFSVAGGIFLSFRASSDKDSFPESSSVARDLRLLRRSFVLPAMSCYNE